MVGRQLLSAVPGVGVIHEPFHYFVCLSAIGHGLFYWDMSLKACLFQLPLHGEKPSARGIVKAEESHVSQRN